MHAPAHPTPAQRAVQDDDMFADVPLEPASTAPGSSQIEFTGQLVRNADVRTQPAADGLHAVPIVCMQLKSTGSGTARTCYAQQPFTDATRPAAEALARRLTKGCIVTVKATLQDIHVTFPHAQLIEMHPSK